MPAILGTGKCLSLTDGSALKAVRECMGDIAVLCSRACLWCGEFLRRLDGESSPGDDFLQWWLPQGEFPFGDNGKLIISSCHKIDIPSFYMDRLSCNVRCI